MSSSPYRHGDGDDDGNDTFKAVRNALGPDAKCDPYPKPEFKDGAALFLKRHAAAFYAEHPDLQGTAFSVLKRNHHKNPMVQQVIREYSEENRKYLAVVAEWRAKWPEDAARVDEARNKSSAQRRERKRRQKTGGVDRNAKHSRTDDSLPWLTQEWVAVKTAYLRKCRETGLKLLQTAADLQDAYETHRAFIQEMDRDREDVF